MVQSGQLMSGEIEIASHPEYIVSGDCSLVRRFCSPKVLQSEGS